MTFYAETPSPSLRQGDIILGMPIVEPEKQGAPITDAEHDYKVEVRVCHCVVITPCCSIEEGKVSVSPLRRLLPKVAKHEVFGATPLLINAPVDPEVATGPSRWASLDATRQQELLAEGQAYVWLYMFVFDEHPRLAPYQLRDTETRLHYVDFRSTFTVKWDRIGRDASAAASIKVAELSVESREAFRRKLAHFFGRATREDTAILEATR